LVKTPDLGSLFLTFNTFLCVLLPLLLFEGHTTDMSTFYNKHKHTCTYP